MPRLVDRQQRRAMIAQAAAESIAELGIEATKMTHIAERAGCTTGMVTYYYDDKDEILRAGLGHVAREQGKRIRRSFDSDPSDLHSLLVESLPLDARRRAENRVWISFWGRAAFAGHLAREQRRRHDEGWFEVVHASMEKAQELGLVSPELDLVAEAHAVMAFVSGIGTGAAFSPKLWSAKRQVEHLDRYLSRLAPPKGKESERGDTE